MPFYPGAESFPHGSFPVYTFPKYTWLNYGAGGVAYTGIIDLTVRDRDFNLDVLAREYDGLQVRVRDFALKVEDR